MVSSPFTLQITLESRETFVHCQDPSASKSNRLHIHIFQFSSFMGNFLES